MGGWTSRQDQSRAKYESYDQRENTSGMNKYGKARDDSSGTGSNKAERGEREWFFRMPLQQGPGTPHGRKVRYWMFRILCVQFLAVLLRFIYLLDFTGGLWMSLVIAVGAYGYHEDMNITYICMWGFMCMLNGFFDLIAIIFGLAFRLFTLDFFTILIAGVMPFVYLTGALFAWHLYRDYANRENIPLQSGRFLGDPFGAVARIPYDKDNADVDPPGKKPYYEKRSAEGGYGTSTEDSGGKRPINDRRQDEDNRRGGVQGDDRRGQQPGADYDRRARDDRGNDDRRGQQSGSDYDRVESHARPRDRGPSDPRARDVRVDDERRGERRDDNRRPGHDSGRSDYREGDHGRRTPDDNDYGFRGGDDGYRGEPQRFSGGPLPGDDPERAERVSDNPFMTRPFR